MNPPAYIGYSNPFATNSEYSSNFRIYYNESQIEVMDLSGSLITTIAGTNIQAIIPVD